MSEEKPMAPDGTARKSLVDVQLGMLNHYIYTHQNTLPDSEIWKCIEYVEDLARLGARVQEEAACSMDLMQSGVDKDKLAAFGLAVLTEIRPWKAFR